MEEISATNPCAEQPLPANGACLLGSLNLVKYIQEDEDGFKFDWGQLKIDASYAVILLDCVIDNTIYPLPEQKLEAQNKRRMGIGVTGVANAIERLGCEYGSPEFISTLGVILKGIRDVTYLTSVSLAKQKGAFPLFDADKYSQGQFFKTLPVEIQTLIKTFGLRNSHLLSIAPTGTISLCADNVSSGIEPVFTHTYDRTIIMPDGVKTEEVSDYAYREWGLKGKTAMELKPEEHIGVLAVAQKYCDSAVSKTVNIGDEVTYDEFKDVYMSAYKAGAKGCTTFRASGKRMGVLTVRSETEPQEILDLPEGQENGGEACTFDPTTGRKTCE